MKTSILILLTACLALMSCGTKTQSDKQQTAASAEQPTDCVEVLYFHGKQRCATCMAIEQNTKALIDSLYADQVAGGQLVFKIIDISDSANADLAEKYEVTWSSLFITRHKGGQETTENLTQFAFANARKAPADFKAEVTRKINEMLK